MNVLLSHVNLDNLTVHRGQKYLESMPYVVKGMDVSFSGILSYIEVSFWHMLYFYCIVDIK